MSFCIWKINYNKIKCRWDEISSSTSSSQGNSQWSVEDNFLFCIFTFHNSVSGDRSQPSLPNDVGYPNPPSSSYCGLQYMVWRVVKTSTYVGEPYIYQTEIGQGDDLWRKVTPFEYEIKESNSIFCNNSPKLPSLANTVLKYDDSATYRKFRSKWICDIEAGEVRYFSGPTYAGGSKTRGNNRWILKERVFDDINGSFFHTEWISSVSGVGTFPTAMLDDELLSELTDYCSPEDQEELLEVNQSENVSASVFSIALNEEFAYPNYVVHYDCDEKKLGDARFIGYSLVSEEGAKRIDKWEYFDTSSINGVYKCVYYYLSSDKIKINLDSPGDSEDIPSVSLLDLKKCSCSEVQDVSKTANEIYIFDLIVSGIKGEPSSYNGTYSLLRRGSDKVWTLNTEFVTASIICDGNCWKLNLVVKYSKTKLLSIEETVPLASSYIGDSHVNISTSAEYLDYDGSGHCSLSAVADTIERFSKSSSSES